MSWRIAESLKKLREQINAAYPNRDKASDGGIGDAAHASRDSDHNPWVRDSRGQGVVTAIDIDEDLTPNTNTVMPIIQSIIASRDPRVKYIIYEGKMCSSYPARGFKAWMWRPYSGKNPHRHHAHISVNPAPYHYDSRAEWNINFVKPVVVEPVVLEIPGADKSVRVPSEHAAAVSPETATAEPSPVPASVAPPTAGAAEQPPDLQESETAKERGGEGASAANNHLAWLDKYGDKVASASATADKFGIPRDVVNQSIWSIIQSFGLKIGSGVLLWFASVSENPIPYIVAALALAGMGVFAWKWSRERKHNADEKKS